MKRFFTALLKFALKALAFIFGVLAVYILFIEQDKALLDYVKALISWFCAMITSFIGMHNFY